MNWEAIGAIGEIVGATAVVVSLVYLASQVRQNSRIVKGASAQSLTQNIQTELRWSGDLGEIFLKVIEEPESLTKVEAFKAGEWATAAMMVRQNEYIQYKKNLIDQDFWESNIGIIRNILSIAWFRNWWENIDKAAFTSDFVKLVDSLAQKDQSFDYQKYVKSALTMGDNDT